MTEAETYPYQHSAGSEIPIMSVCIPEYECVAGERERERERERGGEREREREREGKGEREHEMPTWGQQGLLIISQQ